jgi:hypothetical protein
MLEWYNIALSPCTSMRSIVKVSPRLASTSGLRPYSVSDGLGEAASLFSSVIARKVVAALYDAIQKTPTAAQIRFFMPNPVTDFRIVETRGVINLGLDVPGNAPQSRSTFERISPLVHPEKATWHLTSHSPTVFPGENRDCPVSQRLLQRQLPSLTSPAARP